MKQVLIGVVIGVIGLRLINTWFPASTSSSGDSNSKQTTYQLTIDDIEIGVEVSEQLAKFRDNVLNKWYESGELEIQQASYLNKSVNDVCLNWFNVRQHYKAI